MKRKRGKQFRYILTLVSIPAIITAIVFTGIVLNNFSNKIEDRQAQAYSSLKSTAYFCEDSISAVVSSSQLYANDPFISPALSDTNWIYDGGIVSSFDNALNSFPYIHSIYIYNKTGQKVYSALGEFNAPHYFTNICSYDNYEASYWSTFQFYHSEAYRMLSPGNLSFKNNEKSNVIPVVIRKTEGISQKNYLIINIDTAKLLQSTINTQTEAFVYNKYTNKIFFPCDSKLNSSLFQNGLPKALSHNPNGSFYYKHDGDKLLVSTFSTNNSMVGFTYFSIIPVSELLRHDIAGIIMYIAIIAVTLILVIYFAMRSSNKIFTPISYVKSIMSSSTSADKANNINIFDEIISLAEKMRNDNENSQNMVPYAQEKFLIDLLNSTDYHIDTKTRDSFRESFDFKHKYFSVVLVQFAPTTTLFETYNNDEYMEIKSGIYAIIKDTFSAYYTSYVIPAENDILDIIINFEDKKDYDIINIIFKDVYSLFKNDADCINLSIGIGNIATDISGLKSCHDEARNNFILYEQTDSKVKIASVQQEAISFTRSDEDRLFVALSTYDKDRIKKEIARICKKNSQGSKQSLKTLYNYIVNVILKFIRTNNIAYETDKLDFEILNKLIKQPMSNLENDIDEMIELISESKSKNVSEAIKDEIIKYVTDNFNSANMSIRLISDMYESSEGNISKIFKAKTNMGFRDYVKHLRIEKARELLLTTDENIDKIYEDCGFTNRVTFIRAFKSVVGQTPSEYRNDNKQGDR